MIFPFSRNGPAHYNFSLFLKLPTHYLKVSEEYNLHTEKYPLRAICTYVSVLFLKFLGNLLVTLKQ